MSHMPPTPAVIPPGTFTRIYNVQNYGAVGDGVADDTAAIGATITAASASGAAELLGSAIFFPRGSYRITSTLTLPSYVTVKGDSRYTTTLRWSGAAAANTRMFEFVNKYGVGFQDLSITIDAIVNSPNEITIFYLSNCFRFTWQRVIVQGNHTTVTADPQSTGFEFRDNAGDCRIIDCDINALGAGIRTGSIMNYVVGCVFSLNKYSIYGDETGFAGGMVVEACTFTGSGATGGTEMHIRCDVGGNVWRILGCWFEQSRTAIEIGGASGGPQEVGIIGCKIAAVDTGINVRNCPLPYLANITFNPDTTGTPIGAYNDVLINATDAPYGTAMGLRRSDAFDYSAATFPDGWSVSMRGAALLPPLTVRGAVTMSSTLGVTGASTLTGDVGMGAAPSSGNKCHVQGNAACTGGWYTNASRTNGMNESGGTLQFRAGNADARMTLDSAGKMFVAGETEIDGALNHDGTTVGFYGTAPIAKQTGVAVDAAGIHAALVALGLITA